jgi:ribosomal protein L11 methyltransferase
MPKPAERWTRFSLRVPAAVADPLGTRCIELGAPGVVVGERNLRRDATTDGGVRPARPAATARFTAYFPPDVDPHWLEAQLRACLDAIARELPGEHQRSFHLEPFQPPRLGRASRGHFPPVRVGKRLLVAPSWTSAKDLRTAAGRRIVLQVDPAQAFGTGHHPTTRGCLVALERICAAGSPPRRGLDIGSGTGILAVAMRALGVPAVTAVDTDPAARAATLACAAANDFADVRVAGSLGRARGQYEVITANLFAGLLIDLAPQLAARVRPRGHLIVAGLLASQEADVLRALRRAGFRPARRECRATWSTLTLVRSATPVPRARAAVSAR